MSKTRTFTKAGLKRAISAAREAGLRVTGIQPDGTLLLSDAPLAPADQAAHTEAPSPEADAWRHVEA